MFKVISKDEYWRLLDTGIQKEVRADKISFQLKHVQDLVVLGHLRELKGKRIAEIGGGDSRILEALAKHNRCFNIDEQKGEALGPRNSARLDGVENIYSKIGSNSLGTFEGSFDAVFSISVLEHIEDNEFSAFVDEHHKLLASGGIFVHAIDLYLGDELDEWVSRRIALYKSLLCNIHHGFSIIPCTDQSLDGDLTFKSWMASNPDNILYGWNKLVPRMSQTREAKQSVSLLLAGRKF